MFNQCHLIWKWTTQKTIFQHNLCIGVYGKYLQVDRRKIKRWSKHWGMHSSIGNTWVPVKIRCIADYCKTKACLIGVVPLMGLLLLHADVLNCWSWVTVEYISVQEEDSKVEQMNYVMRKVKLKLNLQNEQISIRNTREIHEIGQNSNNKHFF